MLVTFVAVVRREAKGIGVPLGKDSGADLATRNNKGPVVRAEVVLGSGGWGA